MKYSKFIWPVVGIGAAVFSGWLLYSQMKKLSFDGTVESLSSISPQQWLLAAAATLAAYTALAGYDRIALKHLRREVPLAFVALCSFTSYALSHSIGATVVSGAVIRYRAYATRGLGVAEVGILVAFCSITFAMGVIVLLGTILAIRPDIADRFGDILPVGLSRAGGVAMLAAVALYIGGGLLSLPVLKLGRLSITYPRPGIIARQLVVGPLELIGAAAIIYFVLPSAENPGFIVVLGIFLLSFTVALLSHAPGGIGVLELVFMAGLPEMDSNAVLAALLVFRLLYLILPLAFAIMVVLFFERSQMAT
ncbi:MAG TPA: YbhN family protein [Rhizobiaceae bacterium]|nr:YbhN family protein [Rhizobiaceae bacterium]